MPVFPSLPEDATTKHIFTAHPEILLALGARFGGDPAWPIPPHA